MTIDGRILVRVEKDDLEVLELAPELFWKDIKVITLLSVRSDFYSPHDRPDGYGDGEGVFLFCLLRGNDEPAF